MNTNEQATLVGAFDALYARTLVCIDILNRIDHDRGDCEIKRNLCILKLEGIKAYLNHWQARIYYDNLVEPPETP